jgi:hypothetical protein
LKIEFLAVAALAVTMAGAAHAADTHSTVEIGVTGAQLNSDGLNFDVTAIDIRGGFQLNKNWGAEMEGAFGVSGSSTSVPGGSISLKEDWEIGLFGVGYLPVGHNIDLFGRLGFARTQAAVSGGSLSLAGQDYGAAAGVGIRQFPGGGNNGWRVDYTHHFYNPDRMDTFSVGYVRRF